MNSQRPVSLRMIADLANVTKATVSLALRHSPSISAATRERVQKIADGLGYKRNEIVSSVLSRSRHMASTGFSGTLGFLYYWDSEHEWKKFSYLRQEYEGVLASADQTGFKVDVIRGSDPAISPDRLNQILKTRGINKVLLPAPQRAVMLPQLDWDNVSAVTLGWRMHHPALSYVQVDEDNCIWRCFMEVKARGYQRIGLALWRGAIEKSEGRLAARYFLHQQDLKPAARLKAFFSVPWEEWNLNNFEKWLRAEKPDAIICQSENIESWLGHLGVRVPQDVGFVHLGLPQEHPKWSGMRPKGHQIGAAAVEILLSQTLHSGLGLHPAPRGILIESEWVPGQTIRHE